MPVSLATLCRLLTFATDAAFIGSLGPTFFAAVAVAQVPLSFHIGIGFLKLQPF